MNGSFSGELKVVPVSPLNAPGLMTARGWDTLRGAASVALSCAHPAWEAHVREAGIECVRLESASAHELARSIGVWLEDSDGCPGGYRAWLCDSEHPHLPSPIETIGALDEASGGPIDADYVFASPVAPGAAVVESVRIMHELRSPGGDPWSAAQTHGSLSRYLLEETHEVLAELEREPIRTSELVDEFGDLLFQLVFHARIGMEEAEPWTLDSVARSLNAKMYRRNPHVFGPEREDLSIEEITARWDRIKSQEKPRRALAEGIPLALPALQRAFKIAARAQAAGREEELRAVVENSASNGSIASRIMAIVLEAAARDEDPESALRALVARVEAQLARD